MHQKRMASHELQSLVSSRPQRHFISRTRLAAAATSRRAPKHGLSWGRRQIQDLAYYTSTLLYPECRSNPTIKSSLPSHSSGPCPSIGYVFLAVTETHDDDTVCRFFRSAFSVATSPISSSAPARHHSQTDGKSLRLAVDSSIEVPLGALLSSKTYNAASREVWFWQPLPPSG